MQSLKKFLKDMFQLAVMSIVAYYFISRNIDNILYSGYYNLGVISAVFFKILAQLFLYLLLIYLFWVELVLGLLGGRPSTSWCVP